MAHLKTEENVRTFRIYILCPKYGNVANCEYVFAVSATSFWDYILNVFYLWYCVNYPGNLLLSMSNATGYSKGSVTVMLGERTSGPSFFLSLILPACIFVKRFTLTNGCIVNRGQLLCVLANSYVVNCVFFYLRYTCEMRDKENIGKGIVGIGASRPT